MKNFVTSFAVAALTLGASGSVAIAHNHDDHATEASSAAAESENGGKAGGMMQGGMKHGGGMMRGHHDHGPSVVINIYPSGGMDMMNQNKIYHWIVI